MPYKIFSGVYELFSQTGVTDSIFTSEKYLSDMKRKINAALLPASSAVAFGYQAIPILAGILSSCALKRPFRILDFGGGGGINYLRLEKVLKSRFKFEYHILDSEHIINIAKELIPTGINFENRFDRLSETYDFLLIQSVLQYIEELDDIFKLLASKNPQHILLEDTFLSNNEEFVTVQDYYGLKQPFKVHDYSNLCRILLSLGYALVYECPQIMPVGGDFKFYDMSNLPADRQLSYSYSLLFAKNC